METYEFKQPFEMTTNGQDFVISSIEVEAPTAKDSKWASYIEQALSRALVNMQKNFTKEQIQEMSGEDKSKKNDTEEDKIKGVREILALGDADMHKCFDNLKQCIACSNRKAKFNGEVDCNKIAWESIPYKELGGLLGWYIVNFTDTLV
jgi:hypothetical protein